MTSYKTQTRLESRIISIAKRLEHERTLGEYAKDVQEYTRLMRKYLRATPQSMLHEAAMRVIEHNPYWLKDTPRRYHD